jgi:hypothetical protein
MDIVGQSVSAVEIELEDGGSSANAASNASRSVAGPSGAVGFAGGERGSDSLQDCCSQLKRSLQLTGPMTAVVEQACERLGVAVDDDKGDRLSLIERARRCCDALGTQSKVAEAGVPLYDLCSKLKRRIQLTGPMTAVVEQACERLGVAVDDDKGDRLSLIERARRCCDALDKIEARDPPHLRAHQPDNDDEI